MIPVLTLDELPEGSKKMVTVDGKDICLYHLSDGIFATDNKCSHAESSLAAGWLVSDCWIECARHGSRFNIKTGDVLSLPATHHLRTYPVTIQENTIYVSATPNNPA